MSDSKTFFFSVTERIFSNWTALKMAVDYGSGSKEKAQNFSHYMTEIFYMNDDLDADQVASELENYMDEEFDTVLDDGSALQVAEELLRFYRVCVSGDEITALSEFEKLPPLQSWITATSVPVKSRPQSTSHDHDSSSDEDSGWKTVQSRRKI